MSTNCISCISEERTGTDLLCDSCRSFDVWWKAFCDSDEAQYVGLAEGSAKAAWIASRISLEKERDGLCRECGSETGYVSEHPICDDCAQRYR